LKLYHIMKKKTSYGELVYFYSRVVRHDANHV